MTARRIAFSALGLAVAVAALVILLSGGEDPYRIQLRLANAGGLDDGAEVTIADIKAGKASLHLGEDDKAIVDLEIDPDEAPVGRDAAAAISTVNLLGTKRVELDKGDVSDPAPSGFVIPANRVTVSTDLDQVLDLLDADTRTRLAVLISETGAAVSSRRADIRRLLGELPPSVADATRLLNTLVSDNQTLKRLVTRSDRFVTRVAGERRSLSRMVDVLGGTAETVAARRAQLRQTLERAPGTLRTLQDFLADLGATTAPLGPAARDITATAPRLSATLAELEPFRRAAEPTLSRATSVAPELTRLARGAPPVLRRANPAVLSLATFGRELVPVTDALDRSVDNVLAVVENWSRAIQVRDGMSHVFRGEASMTPETLQSLIRRLQQAAPLTTEGREPRKEKPGSSRAGASTPREPTERRRSPQPQLPRPGESRQSLSQLLDYFLGP